MTIKDEKTKLKILCFVETEQESSLIKESFPPNSYEIECLHVGNTRRITDELRQFRCDVAYICIDKHTVSQLKQTISTIKSVAKNVPIICLKSAHYFGEMSPGLVIGIGARDLVVKSDARHLVYATEREMEVVRLRASYKDIKDKMLNSCIVSENEPVHSYDTDDHNKSVEMISMVEDSITNGRLKLVFQPMFSVSGDEWKNYEVLVRLLDSTGNVHMPNTFIPIAERFGLMVDIDRAVLRESIRILSQEQKSGSKLRFFVNMSSHSLGDPNALSTMLGEIEDSDLQPGSFVFEISKNSVLSKVEHAKKFNAAVKKLGLKFLLDHYELNDTKLNYLDHIDIDYLKIDRGIITSVLEDDNVLEHIQTIVRRAQNNGLKTIAHGVESAEVMARLFNCGVDYLQGYAVQAPTETLEFDFESF